ncbi:MAG: DUF2007 domain-containing protein [Cocleimonas sp.]
MKLVHTAEDRVYLYHLKNILETQGIESIIKNDRLSSLAGEIPMVSVWPELWVTDPMKVAWAKEIIEETKNSAPSNKTWVCKNCNEEHSTQFTECWNCQSIKAF